MSDQLTNDPVKSLVTQLFLDERISGEDIGWARDHKEELITIVGEVIRSRGLKNIIGELDSVSAVEPFIISDTIKEGGNLEGFHIHAVEERFRELFYGKEMEEGHDALVSHLRVRLPYTSVVPTTLNPVSLSCFIATLRLVKEIHAAGDRDGSVVFLLEGIVRDKHGDDQLVGMKTYGGVVEVGLVEYEPDELMEAGILLISPS